jgi:hypothetical protein
MYRGAIVGNVSKHQFVIVTPPLITITMERTKGGADRRKEKGTEKEETEGEKMEREMREERKETWEKKRKEKSEVTRGTMEET